MKTVIMAGGMGTRIASVRSDVPKPMIEIGGKPILEHQMENLKACGLTDITLVVGHLGDVIRQYFGDGSRFGLKISYFVEDHPLGTAGALFQMPELTEDFLLLCGDVMIDVDFNRFADFHRKNRAWASLMAHPNGHPYDSSLLVTEIVPPQEPGGLPTDSHRVVRWLAKEDERLYYKNRVNAGIQTVSGEDSIMTILFTKPGYTMRFKAPEGYKFGKMLFYDYRESYFLIDTEETLPREYQGSIFYDTHKIWIPTTPQVNKNDLNCWEGDESNILFNCVNYFKGNFMKIDMRLVPDGTSGIDNVQRSTFNVQRVPSYTLDGRRIANGQKPTAKGVYIMDGKKHVVK